MNINTEETQDITGTLISLKYDSSIGIAGFRNENGEFILYGESRLMSILEDYINQELILFIKSESDWSWLPLEDNLTIDEIE